MSDFESIAVVVLPVAVPLDDIAAWTAVLGAACGVVRLDRGYRPNNPLSANRNVALPMWCARGRCRGQRATVWPPGTGQARRVPCRAPTRRDSRLQI
jgi:hypothetical protein